MKPRHAVGLAFALGVTLACAQPAFSSVRVEPLQESSQRPRITVLLDGKPVAHVKVAVSADTSPDKPLLTLISGENGRVSPPRLRPGNYMLRASPSRDLAGGLFLHINSFASPGNRFAMELERYDPPPTFEELVAAAERSAAAETSPKFGGLVVDQTGAKIPKTSIDVVIRGTNGNKHAAKLKSNALGEFSTDLPDGDYVAVFTAPGFSTRVVPITIAKAGPAQELRIVMKVVFASSQ
jgi:hypothetical protein